MAWYDAGEAGLGAGFLAEADAISSGSPSARGANPSSTPRFSGR